MEDLRDAAEALRTGFAGDPDGLRAFALDLLRERTQSASALWYRFGLVDGDPVPTRWLAPGMHEAPMRSWRDERIPWLHGDPRVADHTWDRRFVLLRSMVHPDKLWPTRLYRRCYEPIGLHDQLRLVVYHEGCFVGWMGALRVRGEPPFTRADLRRVRPLADAMADAMIAAERTERADTPEEGSDLVLCPDGTIEFASEDGCGLLGRPGARDELRAWVRGVDAAEPGGASVIRGHRARWTRLHGAGGVHYLVNLEPIATLRLHPTFALSRTQREIATLAAEGATVPEIAGQRDMAESTVRAHVRQVYERLGVSTRVDLARALSDMPRETPHREPPVPRHPNRSLSGRGPDASVTPWTRRS